MRHSKHNGGFSLIEILVAMVLLGLIVVPITSSLLVSHRINAKTEQLLQAQLAVSSAAEILHNGGTVSDADVQFEIPGQDPTNELSGNFVGSVVIRSTVCSEVSVTTYIGG